MSVASWLTLFQNTPEEDRKIGEEYRLIRIKEDYDRVYDWLANADSWDGCGRRDVIGGLTGGKAQMVRMIKPDSLTVQQCKVGEMPVMVETEYVDQPTMVYLDEIPKNWADLEVRGIFDA